MPLHLLGKKNWNVYNVDNVERVRRDEADAKAREEAAEQRMQEEDAARRIALLRGEEPPALPARTARFDEHDSSQPRRKRDDAQQPRKRRRLRGEDDTDRDIRYAREDAEAGEAAKQTLNVKKGDEFDAPLHDHAGHIQLLAPPKDEFSVHKTEKNADAEAEKERKRRRDEDRYTMRFSNAPGFQKALEKPWYAASTSPSTQAAAAANSTPSDDRAVATLSALQDKNVWGNDDPLRKERERSRISTNDPFAAMQQAQRQLKQSEADRQHWRKKRLAEVEELKSSKEHSRRREKKHHHRRSREDDENSIEGFDLNAPSDTERRERHDNDHSRRRRHQRRRRSRSQSRDRHR